jgi:hypothetical protein
VILDAYPLTHSAMHPTQLNQRHFPRIKPNDKGCIAA